MSFPFANQKRDAGVGTPVLPTTGGTAAGSVGAAVPLPWMATLAWTCILVAAAGCARDIRQSAYFPESMTAGVTEDFDAHGRAVRTAFGTSFKWRLKPAPVIAVSPADPNLNQSTADDLP